MRACVKIFMCYTRLGRNEHYFFLCERKHNSCASKFNFVNAHIYEQYITRVGCGEIFYIKKKKVYFFKLFWTKKIVTRFNLHYVYRRHMSVKDFASSMHNTRNKENNECMFIWMYVLYGYLFGCCARGHTFYLGNLSISRQIKSKNINYTSDMHF